MGSDPQLAAPNASEISHTLLTLLGACTEAHSTEDIVQRHLRAFEQLLPGRLFVVHLGTDANVRTRTSGTLRENHPRARLSAHAARRLSAAGAAALRVEGDYRPWLEEGVRGLDALIGDANAPRGVLAMEYPNEVAPPPGDEAALEQMAGHLDAALQAHDLRRERDTLHSKLEQAQKLATVGQLAAGVVHELSNPLTSISVYAEYLLSKARERGDAAADVEKLRRIAQCADRVMHLNRDIVGIARPTSHVLAPVDIHETLDQSVVFCDHLLTARGARTEKRYATSLPTVSGVRSQLLQVFVNLLTNACQAMPQGQGDLLLETCTQPRGWVHIAIEDNGEGIEEAHRESIFEPFFTTRGDSDGTGLGLWIVRDLLERHGGAIGVREGRKSGARFEIRLPVRG